MKNYFFIFTAIILMCFKSSAQTIIPAGNVSGTWTLVGSPYLIQGHIIVPADSTLNIEPGVTIEFQGHYKFSVLGRIIALGNVPDTIVFTATNTTTGWWGLRYNNTSNSQDSSLFNYCKIQYGNANGTASDADGGAIFLYNYSKVRIANSHIVNNTASSSSNGGGGGIYCYSSSPIIENNNISYNIATNHSGGGIYCYNNSSPIIANNYITNNGAYSGGGIACNNAGSAPIIKNNRILFNESAQGGGIYCDNTSVPVIIDRNIISNNNAYNGGGGGIALNNCSPIISCNTITNNIASSAGGGILTANGGFVPTITNNIICNNTATSQYGGGIYCYDSSPNIYNCTIANNKATATGNIGGGGLYCFNSNPVFKNDILWGNIATNGNNIFLDDNSSDPPFNYCDLQGANSGIYTNGNPYIGNCDSSLNEDPLFVSPSGGAGTNYNGLIANWSLQSNSPCINSGIPDTIGLNLSSTDISGMPRISDERIDMGAYEYLNISSNEVLNSLLINYFPNPVSDKVTIIIPYKAKLEILNVEGQIIQTINNAEFKSVIDLSYLSSGVYLIKVTTDNRIALKKFIKQ